MPIENDLKRIADALEGQLTIMQKMYGNGGGTITTTTPAPVETTADDPLAVPGEKKRGRPRKEEAAAVETVAEAAPVSAAPKEKVTEQLLREELRQYIVRHESKGKGKGMEAASALLVKFNAKTVSTIKPEDYAAIVEHCRKDKAAYDAANGKK